MNDQTYNLILEILKSDLPRESKDEIVRFYTLPPNTPIQPKIEQVEIENKVETGGLKRPNAHTLARKADPKMAKEEDAMTDTLKGRVDG